MKLEFSVQIFEKYSYVKFHKNPSSGIELSPTDEQTDMTKLVVSFRSFANAPKYYVKEFSVQCSPLALTFLKFPRLRSLKISMECWWNDTDRGKPTYSERNVSQGHFVDHKAHGDWPGIEPGSSQWRNDEIRPNDI
jgi:hypothetical protein